MSTVAHVALCFLIGAILALILLVALPVLIGMVAHFLWVFIQYGWNL